MPAKLDIEVPRDGHYSQTWQLRDDLGIPLDLTSHVISSECQASAGPGPVIASADIDIFDHANGLFGITYAGSDFAAVEGESERVRLSYSVLDRHPDGIIFVAVRGHLILAPENS